MKMLLASLLALYLLFMCTAGLCEAATATAVEAVTDGNAMAITLEVVNTQGEADLYYTLEKVYVNGLEVSVMRSSGRTFGFLNEPLRFTITLDTSDIGRAESYTIATSFSILRPEKEITIIDSQITDDFETYSNNITQFNNAGYIVATKEGDILLAPGTYDDTWQLSGQLTQTGKMSLIETLPIVFQLPMGEFDLKQGSGSLDMGEWALSVQKAEATQMSITVIINEVFPETFTTDQVYGAMRLLTVTDEGGGKSFYSGFSQSISEPTRRASDGTWLVTFKWCTQSVNSIPPKLRITPYTYDATMSPVEETDFSLIVPLE